MSRVSLPEEGPSRLRDAVQVAESLYRKLGGHAVSVVSFRALGLRETGDEAGARFWMRVERAIGLLAAGARGAEGPPRPALGERGLPVLDAGFRHVFDALPHAYLLMDPNLVIGGANPEFLTATMTSRGQLLGAGFFDIFPEGPGSSRTARRLRSSFERVLDTGRPDALQRQRYDIRGPDGAYQERWWDIINRAVFDADARLILIVHHLADVTQAVRAA